MNIDTDSRIFRVLHTGCDEEDQVVAVSEHVLPVSLWSLTPAPAPTPPGAETKSRRLAHCSPLCRVMFPFVTWGAADVQSSRSLSPVAIGALIMTAGLVGIVVGHVSAKGWTWSGLVSDVGTSVDAELVAVAVTVLMIDRPAERRESVRLRQQLVREASSTDHGLALRAILELDVRGWLAEGALVEARLRDANLHDIVLEGQDLHGADLVGANLRKANLSRANLTDCDFNRPTCPRP
ncbi:pentapeptide repeat-containing protein [Streptomyces sp. NPDC004647]|uniref:pentapeptide repeat-containing protein n=1 Tax=Streptomyces sp. NPDC004647 TaxID=3154671 RepID=UPI0033B3E6C1